METCAYLIKSPSEVRLARTLLYALGGKRRWIFLPVCLSPRGMLRGSERAGMRRNRIDGRLLPGLVDSLLLCVSDGAVVGAELASPPLLLLPPPYVRTSLSLLRSPLNGRRANAPPA